MFEAAKALFAQVHSALAEEDLSGIAPVALGLDIKQLSGFINLLEVERARRVALFDRERGFASTPDTSTTSWLRNNCHLSGFSADRQVKLARQLPELGGDPEGGGGGRDRDRARTRDRARHRGHGRRRRGRAALGGA